MPGLTDMPNIGKKIAEQLVAVGIETPARLNETGSKEAWLMILEQDDSACYNRLCGLEGAIRGVRWQRLPVEVRQELKDFYVEVKKARKES